MNRCRKLTISESEEGGVKTYNFHYGFPQPGPQQSDINRVFDHIYFTQKTEWKQIREYGKYNYVVIGTGFCSLAFTKKILEEDPEAKVLVLERGGAFLQEHFQNLPPPYKATLPSQIFHTETYPWTLSYKSVLQPAANWMHGMVPFFGGRSTLWSAWCPRPEKKFGELQHWPDNIIELMDDSFFSEAEKLLNVKRADEIDENVEPKSKIFYHAQKTFQGILEDAIGTKDITGATHSMAAPLAVGDPYNFRDTFSKYSVNGAYLELLEADKKQAKGDLNKRRLFIMTNCIVEKIEVQHNPEKEEGKQEVAVALITSRGVVPLVLQHRPESEKIVNLVLAVGCMPAATMLLNSFNHFEKQKIMLPGSHFGAHFISAITARIPRKLFEKEDTPWNSLEIGALYLAGLAKDGMTFHTQISILSDKEPKRNAATALKYMPDVVATATPEQLGTSQDYVVFVCAALGEMDVLNNKHNHLRKNDGLNPTSNVTLQWKINEIDKVTWEGMEKATYDALKAFALGKEDEIEYWHANEKDPNIGTWEKEKPKGKTERVDGMVHESSLCPMGTDKEKSVVDSTDFRVHGTSNCYMTGSSLWPTANSWNPTMTMVGFAQVLAKNLADSKKAAKTIQKT